MRFKNKYRRKFRGRKRRTFKRRNNKFNRYAKSTLRHGRVF